MTLGELVAAAEEYAPEGWGDFRIAIESDGPGYTNRLGAAFDVAGGECRISDDYYEDWDRRH